MSGLRIAFCWTGLTGYMPSCWRALAKLPDVEQRIYIETRRASTAQHAFREDGLDGLRVRVRERDDCAGVGAWLDELVEFRPDLVEVTGWVGRLQRAVVRSPRLSSTPKILGLDLSYRGTWRQRLAPYVLRSYLRRFCAVCVPGERAAAYARHLGFAEAQIERGLYGFDYDGFAEAAQARPVLPWPARFVFVGRYCEDKGVDVLLKAYRCYRLRVPRPWPLTCCGMGPLADAVCREEGVTDAGFLQPEQMPGFLAGQGVFILPSRYEPWGVALGEACASGLPVIASRACGSTAELVRAYDNGLLCEAGSSESLVDAMLWMHGRADELPVLSARSQALARPYAAQAWARSWYALAVKRRLGA